MSIIYLKNETDKPLININSHLLQPTDSTIPYIKAEDCFEFIKNSDVSPSLTTSGSLSSTQNHQIYIKLKWPYLNSDLSNFWDTYTSGYSLYLEVNPSCMNAATSTTSTLKTRRQIEDGVIITLSYLGVVKTLSIGGYIVDENNNKIYNLKSWYYNIYEDAGTDTDKYINGILLGKNSTTTESSVDIYPSESEPFAIMLNSESASTTYFNIIASNNSYEEIPCLYSKKNFDKGDNFIFSNTTFTDLKGVVSTSTIQVLDEEYQVGGLFYSNPYTPTANPIYDVIEDQTEYKDVVIGNDGTGRFRLTIKKPSATEDDIFIYKLPIASSLQLSNLVSMSIKCTQTGSSTFIAQFQITNNSNFKVWPGGTILFYKNNQVSISLNLSSWIGTSGIVAKGTATYTISTSATSSSEYTFSTYGYCYYYLDSNRTIWGNRYNSVSAYDAGLYYFTPEISYTNGKVYLTNKDKLFNLIGDNSSPTVGLVVKQHSRTTRRRVSKYITSTQKTGYAVSWKRYIDGERYHTKRHPCYEFSLDKDTGEIIGMEEFLKHFERTVERFHDIPSAKKITFTGYVDTGGNRFHQNQYYGVVFKNYLYESQFSTQSIKVSYKGAKKLITGYSDDE